MGIRIEDLNPEHQNMLTQYGFEKKVFEAFASMLQNNMFPPKRNQLQTHVHPPLPSDIQAWPSQEDASFYIAKGTEALQKGQVAAVVLNGGMATRFGGGVKGIVPVYNNHSFLSVKLRDIQPYAMPVFLLNSFATDEATRAHLQQQQFFGIPENLLHVIHQGVGVRLTPEGALVYDAPNTPSLYAPGHGDVLEALHRSHAFQQFVSQGGRMVVVSNVDNLGASISPLIIGAHIQSQADVTVEVVERYPGDKGGAPARVDNKVQIIEGFRFPSDFNIESIPVFNTNTFVLNTSVVHPRHPLAWYRADKTVQGKPVVQFERLLGEITSFVNTHYLQVPREGEESRFLPVKTPEDLETLRPVFEQMCKKYVL
jgi:UTP--glucose-1-phosphate uridylyltransferase